MPSGWTRPSSKRARAVVVPARQRRWSPCGAASRRACPPESDSEEERWISVSSVASRWSPARRRASAGRSPRSSSRRARGWRSLALGRADRATASEIGPPASCYDSGGRRRRGNARRAGGGRLARRALVWSTGGPPLGPDPLGFSRAQWEAAYRELVLAPLALVEAAMPGMRSHGFGRVVSVSSSSPCASRSPFSCCRTPIAIGPAHRLQDDRPRRRRRRRDAQHAADRSHRDATAWPTTTGRSTRRARRARADVPRRPPGRASRRWRRRRRSCARRARAM